MKNILILEDDKDLAFGMEMALKCEEYSFEIYKKITEVETVIQSKSFDLLILDVNLPDGSGFDLCQKIRKESKVPIIILTARDMELDIVRGLECGADDYITKPFSTIVLRARIRALLRRTNTCEEKKYEQGIFKFDFYKMEFKKNGIPFELSKTEQRILSILVNNQGQIISRERMMEWVWGDGMDYVEDNALSVSIRRLRDKLEEKPSKPKYIITKYGLGYIWGKL